MALNATTLASAVGLTDTTVTLTSGTGVSAPNYQTGDPTKGIAATVTYLLVEQEIMKVSGPALGGGSTVWPVVRGELGSIQAAHASSAPIVAGLPADFASFVPAVRTAVPQYPIQFQGFSAPVASASTIVASGPYFHVTGTTTIATITAPTNYVEGGEIHIVFDGVAAWSAAGNIAVAGTPTTAGSEVTFTFDQGSGKWHPSRLA